MMFLDVVVHLLQSGASTTIEDIHGDTPLDVATNDVIALAMLLHRQRLENFEFTSHERCWYRARSVQRWKNVNHLVLWREVVHLYVTQSHEKREKRLLEMEAMSSMHGGSNSSTTVGGSGTTGGGSSSSSSSSSSSTQDGRLSRPGSHRSRSGRPNGLSSTRMERIRRMQQDSKTTNSSGAGSDNHLDADDSMELASEVTGWRSASKSKPGNSWVGRYHRALAFLRVRGARDQKGFTDLLKQQESKIARRQRRSKRRVVW